MLTELNLNANYVGDKGATALAEALKVNKTLAELHLARNNGISNEEATALAEALDSNRTLTHLNLAGNYGIRDEGTTAFAMALERNTTLTMLELSHTSIRNFETYDRIADRTTRNRYWIRLDPILAEFLSCPCIGR